MADPQQVDEEFGRRLAAARGYSRAPSAKDWARRIGVDRGTLKRYELGKIEPEKRAWAIDQCIAETGLPRLFFAVDFNDLPEMVAAWRQVQSADRSGKLDDLIRDQERDEADALQAGPSELPPEAQDPEDEDQ
jgi:transcriptional regulator with XRE-family HTH domain